MSQASAFPDEKNADLDDLCTQLMTLRQKVEAQMRTDLTATIGSAEVPSENRASLESLQAVGIWGYGIFRPSWLPT